MQNCAGSTVTRIGTATDGEVAPAAEQYLLPVRVLGRVEALQREGAQLARVLGRLLDHGEPGPQRGRRGTREGARPGPAEAHGVEPELRRPPDELHAHHHVLLPAGVAHDLAVQEAAHAQADLVPDIELGARRVLVEATSVGERPLRPRLRRHVLLGRLCRRLRGYSDAVLLLLVGCARAETAPGEGRPLGLHRLRAAVGQAEPAAVQAQRLLDVLRGRLQGRHLRGLREGGAPDAELDQRALPLELGAHPAGRGPRAGDQAVAEVGSGAL
mmetsp:Transcript_56652/g.159803  ORF Transcript_56652/g.159803 Transcript_56652/m.159803 type:complete len:271 (+) Transcript_56652:476-1288(+)